MIRHPEHFIPGPTWRWYTNEEWAALSTEEHAAYFAAYKKQWAIMETEDCDVRRSLRQVSYADQLDREYRHDESDGSFISGLEMCGGWGR